MTKIYRRVWRVVWLILFPESLHVRDVGMKATVDPTVWDYAKDNDLMIVSKDADMRGLS